MQRWDIVNKEIQHFMTLEFGSNSTGKIYIAAHWWSIFDSSMNSMSILKYILIIPCNECSFDYLQSRSETKSLFKLKKLTFHNDFYCTYINHVFHLDTHIFKFQGIYMIIQPQSNDRDSPMDAFYSNPNESILMPKL